MSHLEKIDILAVPEEAMGSLLTHCRDTQGDTPVEDLRSRHVDLVHLDSERLALIARVLAPRIRSGTSVYSFTRRDLIKLIRQAVRANRITVTALNDKLREQVGSDAD